jgi:aspartyl-tRNA(Asn)/glutamyl-tRNA(Gln) amidotransferase subunit C|tara:strand:- start:2743 stop:3021 length:279 start_codon:yes stop_codon:yes gene_type:complete
MKINNELVKKVAKISRLDLSEKEISKFKSEFEEVLTHFSEIDKIETDETVFNSLNTKNQFREDFIKSCLSKEAVFQNTKNREGDFFKSPKIK